MSARYKGTSPAVTKGLVIGVPLSELVNLGLI